MKTLTALALCAALLLAGCNEDNVYVPPETKLPPIPADIQRCFVGVVVIPKRALTVGDVERLWKSDRVRSIAMQRCGTRLLAWYTDLRASWR